MNTRKKKIKLSCQDSDTTDSVDDRDARKSRIRDSNKEYARRMTILTTWTEYWSDYTTRDGDAYPQNEARGIMRRYNKITCPIANCKKAFTSIGGLRYHYARCNIEQSFKCNVCQPPEAIKNKGELLRHMILRHINELPALNEDQKLIAAKYSDSSERATSSRPRRESSKRTVNVSKTYDSESTFSSSKLISSFNDLHRKVFLSDGFNDRPFKDWLLSSKDWDLITQEMDRKRYYPPEFESCYFKLAKEGEKFTKIKTGESVTLSQDKDYPTSSIFYTGGQNSAIAWLPKSHHIQKTDQCPELVAIAVNTCSLDKSMKYRETTEGTHSIQFWTIGSTDRQAMIDDNDLRCSLSYIVGHNFGMIYEMVWCPLGSSWQPPDGNNQVSPSRVGLLALACGDGKIRILNVPHTKYLLTKALSRTCDNIIEATPIFRTKPVACLAPPGVGPSTDYKSSICTSICWNLEDNQKLIVAGYSNGIVAIFDLSNGSPILYTNDSNCHSYQPLRSWTAHGAPVTGVGISTISSDRTCIATASTDRFIKTWNVKDLSSCLMMEKSPLTKLVWDYRVRGVVTACESAFSSFTNRVRYSYPTPEGCHNVTVATHRTTVWGLANSMITNAIVSTDQAGEVQMNAELLFKMSQKRLKALSSHSLYSMIPKPLGESIEQSQVVNITTTNGDNNSSTLNREGDKSLSVVDISADNVCQDADPDGDVPNQEEEVQLDEFVERDVVNKPTKFLLPLEHAAVETYTDFKKEFGLEFVNYNQIPQGSAKFSESCTRPQDIANIYCDRHCDYPFSAVNLVEWSPNLRTFSYLITGSRVGFCRLDRVQLVERLFRQPVETFTSKLNISTT